MLILPTTVKVTKGNKKRRIFVYTDNMNYHHAFVRIGLFRIKHVCVYYGDEILELLKTLKPLGWYMIRNSLDRDLEKLYKTYIEI